jgi:hypothetical protein
MDRREFLQITTATILSTQGYLPLLAAERIKKKKGRRKGIRRGIEITYTEPAAIEPVTEHLKEFNPVSTGTMSKPFTARYSLVYCRGGNEWERNSVKGSLEVEFSDSTYRTTDTRTLRPKTPRSIVKTELKCSGELKETASWTLDSVMEEIPETHFTEQGSWDGKSMVVKAKSWTQEHSTANPLIGRWALLGLLSSGELKAKPLTFDMLDDSTLRGDQTLRYAGEIEIPIADGTAKLDSYVQTGYGIVPTHYLVDAEGRVQLITMSTTNWALTDLK